MQCTSLPRRYLLVTGSAMGVSISAPWQDRVALFYTVLDAIAQLADIYAVA